MAKLNKAKPAKTDAKKPTEKPKNSDKVAQKPLKAKNEVKPKPQAEKINKIVKEVAKQENGKKGKKGAAAAVVQKVEEVVVVKKGKKGGKVVQAVAPEEAVIAAPAPVVAAPKGKKGKKAAVEVEAKPVSAVVAPQPTQNGKAAKANKKQGKQEVAAAPVVEQKPAAADAKPISKAAKKAANKKAKAAAAETAPAAEAESVAGSNKITKPKAFLEAPTFDEEAFNKIIAQENVKKIVQALTTLVTEESSKKKTIFSDYRYMLNVACHKIANCPKRMAKLKLKHPLVKAGENDIVLIVRDLERGKRVDYEPTIHHFEDLLREKGVEGITILPFNQVRNEYAGFEMKRKLANLYDHYMCDGRIISHAVGVLGSLFQKPRSTLHSVRLEQCNDVGREIKKALSKTAYKQLAKGNLISIPVGTHKHSAGQIADNIADVINQLKSTYPGGLPNIRNIHVRIDLTGTSAMPLYMGLAQAPEETPYLIGLREQKMNKLKREANDVLSKFGFTQDGRLAKLTGEEMLRKRKITEGREGAAEEEEVVVDAKKPKKEKKSKKKNAVVEEEVVEEEKEEENDEEEVEANGLIDDEASEDDGDDDDDEEEDDE